VRFLVLILSQRSLSRSRIWKGIQGTMVVRSVMYGYGLDIEVRDLFKLGFSCSVSIGST
jgi:hypothetical protein